MLRTMTSRAILLGFTLFTLAACSDDEAAPSGHGTPVSTKLFDVATGSELPAPYQLPAGATTRVEVRFYDADGGLLNAELEASHFTSVTFTPAEFATVADVEGQKFQRDVTVTAAAGATAALAVGYGHDAAADEESFGPYDVVAAAAP